jgi:hypothetical protein
MISRGSFICNGVWIFTFSKENDQKNKDLITKAKIECPKEISIILQKL